MKSLETTLLEKSFELLEKCERQTIYALVPERQYDKFLWAAFTREGLEHLMKSTQPCLEYAGFMLVRAKVDELMYVKEYKGV